MTGEVFVVELAMFLGRVAVSLDEMVEQFAMGASIWRSEFI